MTKGRILVVEDDADISNMLRIYFSGQGFDVQVAPRGSQALAMTRQQIPHLIVLDIMLPDMDGYSVCKELRTTTRTSHIPIIFLTQRDERSDKIAGLELGADDYITKPFGMKELLARVRAVLRRTAAAADPAAKVLRVDDLEVDPAKHEVRLRGQPVAVTPTELRLLHHLVRNRGRVFTRAQLLDKAVGPDVVVIDRNIDVHVATLRKKLEDYGDRIATIRGVGYKFAER